MKIICENCKQEYFYYDFEEIIEDYGICNICGKEYCLNCGDSNTHLNCRFENEQRINQ